MLLTRGDSETAAAQFRGALAREPRHVRARLGLIDCLRDMGRAEESLALFPPILDYDAQVRFNYATILAQVRRFSEAAVQFQEVSKLMPEFAPAYINCGNCLVALGDAIGAIEQYRLALEHDPDNRGAAANLARLLEGQKRRD